MLLEANNLEYSYNKRGKKVIDNISLSVRDDEILGLIGSSGCGKSTLGKLLAGFMTPTKGRIMIDCAPIEYRPISPISIIMQNPEKAINPRWKMRRVLEEATIVSGMESKNRYSGDMDTVKAGLIERLGIEEKWLDRYPCELSGGELQRFCVARSLMVDSKYIIADEMSTMLDMITQAQLINVVIEEVKARNMGMIVITHNIKLADRICTRVLHMD